MAKTRECTRRAVSEYKRRQRSEGREKSLSIAFSQSDMELYEHATKQRPTATYIKSLIRDDMKK
jgi:hypothetical protein